MELMTGGEVILFTLMINLLQLFDTILEKEFYSEKEAADTIRPIVDAIKYCHSMNIIHRDIKVSPITKYLSIYIIKLCLNLLQPENLLYSSRNVATSIIKVSDFGLARFVSPGAYATTTCGTPGYVAPEVLAQKPYGKECDYWSIGVVLYIL